MTARKTPEERIAAREQQNEEDRKKIVARRSARIAELETKITAQKAIEAKAVANILKFEEERDALLAENQVGMYASAKVDEVGVNADAVS